MYDTPVDAKQHTILPYTATPCNTMQRTATHCNTMQHMATHGDTLHHTITHCNGPVDTSRHPTTLQQPSDHTATVIRAHYNIMHHTATYCTTEWTTKSQRVINAGHHPASSMQGILRQPSQGVTRPHCNILQHTAMLCRTLQHIAEHCSALQYIQHETATHSRATRTHIAAIHTA